MAFGKRVPGIILKGSPELAAPVKVTYDLGRKKAVTRTLVPTGKSSAPAPVPAPAPVSPISGPLTLRCSGCGATVPASVDATADDLVGVICNKCGADLEVAS